VGEGVEAKVTATPSPGASLPATDSHRNGAQVAAPVQREMNLFDVWGVFVDSVVKLKPIETMLRKSLFLLVGLTAVLTLSAADKNKKPVDISKLPPPSDKTGLTYEKDIKPIIEKSCVKCHSGEKPKSKYRIDTLANAIKGGESGEAAIIPGDSAKSPMVHNVCDLIEDMEMPPTDKRDKYPALTKAQIGILRAWIDQGAK
jgi:hypothetical protein